jgi:DNA polymerase phi
MYSDVIAEEAKKIWIADQFTALVRNGAIPKREDWIQLILNWFAVQGLYLVKRKSAKGLLASVCIEFETYRTIGIDTITAPCHSLQSF